MIMVAFRSKPRTEEHTISNATVVRASLSEIYPGGEPRCVMLPPASPGVFFPSKSQVTSRRQPPKPQVTEGAPQAPRAGQTLVLARTTVALLMVCSSVEYFVFCVFRNEIRGVFAISSLSITKYLDKHELLPNLVS